MTTPHVINEMFAFVASDSLGEGLIAELIGNQWMPLVGADMDRVKSLRPIAERAARQTGKKIKLVKFTTRVHLEDIT